jgi:putative endopeptidase
MVVVILVSFAPSAAAAEVAYITRGDTADLLLTAAADYNAGIRRTDIIRGYENGDLYEDKPVTRAEAFVMLSRAFGELPAPVGDNARSGYSAANFTDIPDWAKSELSNLFGTGIIAGTSATTFSPAGFVTKEQMELMIRRVYALMGTNLKDDFYAAVNKAALDGSVILPGYMGAGSFIDLSVEVNAQVAGIIQEIAGGKTESGDEKNIAALYNNVLDKAARNAAGIAPIKAYLDAIDSAETLDGLMDVNQLVSKELGANLLLGFGLTIDAKDSSRYSLTFATFSPLLGQSGYAGAAEAQKNAYLQYISTLLTLGGMEAAEAAEEARLFWDTEAALAAESLPIHELGNVDKTYNVFTMSQLKDLFPHIDLDALFSLTGMTQTDHIVVSDVGLVEAAAALFDEAHLRTLKTFSRIALLSGFGTCLNEEFQQASDAFSAAYFGTTGNLSDADYAAQVVQNLLSELLGKAYVSRYFSPAAKSDAEEMVSEIIGVYEERIQALTWMSSATKAEAVKKLDTMIIKIGYPDKWESDLEGLVLKSAQEGGSFFDNVAAVTKAAQARYPELQKEKVDNNEWIFTPYTVNACYSQSSNSIEFPAAILQAPFYDVNASREENLGGIGYVIAHEISHAFDNNGAKYDENGNAADWWTAEDYAAFQQLCEKVIAFYDGREVAPGITCSGTLTLSENIADLGAVACITQVAGSLKSPDYAKLYTRMAEIWCSSYSRETRMYLSQMDVHAPDKLRGGLTLATQEEFFEAFGIRPGDGMYIAPEDRVSVW